MHHFRFGVPVYADADQNEAFVQQIRSRFPQEQGYSDWAFTECVRDYCKNDTTGEHECFNPLNIFKCHLCLRKTVGNEFHVTASRSVLSLLEVFAYETSKIPEV
jgi:hypothetical protein